MLSSKQFDTKIITDIVETTTAEEFNKHNII